MAKFFKKTKVPFVHKAFITTAALLVGTCFVGAFGLFSPRKDQKASVEREPKAVIERHKMPRQDEGDTFSFSVESFSFSGFSFCKIEGGSPKFLAFGETEDGKRIVFQCSAALPQYKKGRILENEKLGNSRTSLLVTDGKSGVSVVFDSEKGNHFLSEENGKYEALCVEGSDAGLSLPCSDKTWHKIGDFLTQIKRAAFYAFYEEMDSEEATKIDKNPPLPVKRKKPFLIPKVLSL